MEKKTLLLLSTISFAVAIVAYILYFTSKQSPFVVTALVAIGIGCIFNFLYKKR